MVLVVLMVVDGLVVDCFESLSPFELYFLDFLDPFFSTVRELEKLESHPAIADRIRDPITSLNI